MRETVDLARDLVKIEVELAKDELYQELGALKGAAIAGSVAVVMGILGLATLLVALGLVFGPVVALLVGGGLLIGSVIGGMSAYKAIPKKPMVKTLKRLQTDEKLIKEHLA